MSKTTLTKDERELLASYEGDEWRSAIKRKADLAKYRQVARATFRKDKRVNIRISEKDLKGIQKRALSEGIPYQTLMPAFCTNTWRAHSLKSISPSDVKPNDGLTDSM